MEIDKEKPLYSIGVVAEMLNTNCQLLRIYEKEKLVVPKRTSKNTRLYSQEDVEKLKIIITLNQELGINFAGVEVILNLLEKQEKLQKIIEKLLNSFKENLEKEAMLRKEIGKIVPISKKTFLELVKQHR